MSSINRQYCIVKVEPETGIFFSVEAIRPTIEEATNFLKEHEHDDDANWYVLWAVADN